MNMMINKSWEEGLVSLLSKCNTNLKTTKQIHSHLYITGLHTHPFFFGKLLLHCAISISDHALNYTLRLFHHFPNPDTFMYNTLIRSLSHSSTPLTSLQPFIQLLRHQTLLPDSFSFAFALKGIANDAHSKRPGGSFDDAFGFFRELMREGIRPSEVSLTGVLSACAQAGAFEFEEAHQKLMEIMLRLKAEEGYAPQVRSVLHDIEEEEKEDSVSKHSEKLAAAFGIAKLPKGRILRIVKNLRVCGDCHTVMKLISKVYQVEIVVRDRSRFHSFKGGICSCRDYW
ncbi:hypothetical protein TSUD_208480 [Trifolium subterraneum]|uniref:DYW domain-containing protein n=1 Tax=Trifolium subterraneum TaxID=3900 RepID=A0A2Z6P872_TRISU|nr:hypothetical protein TSUD_208480 [Trifolium subterraneum]